MIKPFAEPSIVDGGAAKSISMGGWISVLCYMAVFTSYAWFIR